MQYSVLAMYNTYPTPPAPPPGPVPRPHLRLRHAARALQAVPQLPVGIVVLFV